MKLLLIIISLILLLLVSAYGLRVFKELGSSLQVDAIAGPLASHDADQSLNGSSKDQILQQLLKVGLKRSPVLDDTGITKHLLRLERKQTDLQQLQQYARDLQYLNQFTAEQHGPIPASFWDVRTEEMEKNQWSEYTLVHQLAQPEWQPYLELLAKSYARFLNFKATESSGNDSALDASLDLFALVENYYHAVPFADLSEHAKEIKGETEAVLMIWQSVVAGTTRNNPLTHKPLFSHSIFARNNVGTMYQYAQAKKMSIGAVWGVSGFAHRYVGTPKNNNQVEHMSISMVLQLVMHEPVLVLDAVEEEKLLLGHANAEESHADMALNNAIHKEFKPRFSKNRLEAVEHLRSVLRTE